MSFFNHAIITLKANYQYPSCCTSFFKRDPLGYALSKYNVTHPTDEQILRVVSVYITHHRNDPHLAEFAQDIQQVSEKKSLTVTRADQIVSAWLILNKNEFLPEEYIDLIEQSEQLNELVGCLRILDDLKGLDRRRFKKLLGHTNNQSTLFSILNLFNNAKLLSKENLDAILQLPSYTNIDAGAHFNGVFVFYTQLNALPTDTTLTQLIFNRLIEENEEQYRQVLNSGNAYQPSISTISENNADRLNFLPGLGVLALAPVGADVARASVLLGLGNR